MPPSLEAELLPIPLYPGACSSQWGALQPLSMASGDKARTGHAEEEMIPTPLGALLRAGSQQMFLSLAQGSLKSDK